MVAYAPLPTFSVSFADIGALHLIDLNESGFPVSPYVS
jgi:hypothetical protein